MRDIENQKHTKEPSRQGFRERGGEKSARNACSWASSWATQRRNVFKFLFMLCTSPTPREGNRGIQPHSLPPPQSRVPLQHDLNGSLALSLAHPLTSIQLQMSLWHDGGRSSTNKYINNDLKTEGYQQRERNKKKICHFRERSGSTPNPNIHYQGKKRRWEEEMITGLQTALRQIIRPASSTVLRGTKGQ